MASLIETAFSQILLSASGHPRGDGPKGRDRKPDQRTTPTFPDIHVNLGSFRRSPAPGEPNPGSRSVRYLFSLTIRQQKPMQCL